MAIQRKIIVIVRNDGTTERIRLTPALEMSFERFFKVSITKLNEGTAATNLYNLAWHCDSEQAKKDGRSIKGDVAEWVQDIDGVDMDLEDILPTPAAPVAAGSPNSPSPLE